MGQTIESIVGSLSSVGHKSIIHEGLDRPPTVVLQFSGSVCPMLSDSCLNGEVVGRICSIGGSFPRPAHNSNSIPAKHE